MSQVQEFVKELYNSGQIEMNKKHYYHREMEKDFNPYELTIASSAACVDILFWAVKDESGKINNHCYSLSPANSATCIVILFCSQFH